MDEPVATLNGGTVTPTLVFEREGDEAFIPLTPVIAAGSDLPERWTACLVVEGFRTTDHRSIQIGALTWRDVPLPLAAQFSNEPGHDGAVPVGQIESITRDGARILAQGTFHLVNADGTPDPEGQKAAELCVAGIMRFLSIDMEVIDYVSVDMETDWYDEVTAGRIGLSTMVMFPAFPNAVIVPEGEALPEPEPYGEPQQPDAVPLIASGDDVDLATPPAEWFRDPCLPMLTHVTAMPNGRVFGHLAGWGILHRGINNKKVYAPHSPSGYRHFANKATTCEDGTRATTGVITMGVGHAPGNLRLASAAAHYDDVSYGKADVAIGEDEHGIWIAGALRPGVTPDEARVFSASDISGDWRPTPEGYELVAALMVNVAGFLVDNALVASASYQSVARVCFAQYGHRDEAGALLAAGMVKRPDPLEELQRRLAVVESVVAPLAGLAADALMASIGEQ